MAWKNKSSTDFPTLNQYQGDQAWIDAFVTRLSFQAPYITVTSPNGGEILEPGSIQNITWDSSGISGSLKITLWKDGTRIDIIADNIDPAPGTGYTVKIKEKDTTVADFSDASFTLAN